MESSGATRDMENLGLLDTGACDGECDCAYEYRDFLQSIITTLDMHKLNSNELLKEAVGMMNKEPKIVQPFLQTTQSECMYAYISVLHVPKSFGESPHRRRCHS